MDNAETQQIQGVYRFGAFRLDAAERRLWLEDKPVSLMPKQFELLFYFVENAGRVTKKSELLDAVWAATYIEETTLARNISWLRKLLEDGANGEKFIETVPKLGYRFIAPVTRSAAEKNALIIEEQIVQHFRGEEIIEINDAPADKSAEAEKITPTAAAHKNLSAPRRAGFKSIISVVIAVIILVGISFIVYQNYFKTDSSKGLTASNLVLLTGATGNENSPAFSPDGRFLAYSWNGGEGVESDIYVKMIGAGDSLQLTKTNVNEQYPVFSPDGKHIAFVRGKYGVSGEVFVMPSLGGTERRVANLFSGNYSISFSPDGKFLAVIDTDNSSPGGQFAVYLIDIKTGERRRLTAPAEFEAETTPRFSPDGKFVAFIRIGLNVRLKGVGQHDLFVVPTTGGEPRQLTFDGTEIHSLAWSADGEYLYFVPYEPPQTFIRRIPAKSGKPETVLLAGNAITNIALSPDGKKIAYVQNHWQTSMWRVPSNGEPAEIMNKANFSQYSPNFSPDGSRIVFQSDRSDTLQVYMMDADGKNVRQITDSALPSDASQFSPDGSLIAFNRKEGKDSINYIMPSEGGAERRISPPGMQDNHPAWSVDGKYIFFTSLRSGVLNLWKMKADGDSSDAIQLTKNGGMHAAPAPDGKFIYYKREGFEKEMWRIPTDGGAEEQLPEFTRAGFYGSWIVQKTGIYFPVLDADQKYRLKFYDFADRRIKDAPGNYHIPSNFAAHCPTTDGKFLLCSVSEHSSNVLLADLQ